MPGSKPLPTRDLILSPVSVLMGEIVGGQCVVNRFGNGMAVWLM